MKLIEKTDLGKLLFIFVEAATAEDVDRISTDQGPEKGMLLFSGRGGHWILNYTGT